jgi:hypothetical protein
MLTVADGGGGGANSVKNKELETAVTDAHNELETADPEVTSELKTEM